MKEQAILILSLVCMVALGDIAKEVPDMGKCEIDNPYETVKWDTAEYLHSVSHQHNDSSQTLGSLWDMGIRHFPMSCYYPSRPVYPLPADFLKEHPGALSAPNAEHAAFGSGDFNCLGSFYTAGSPWRKAIPAKNNVSPFDGVISNLTVFDPDHDPWRGIYTLTVAMEARDEAATVSLTVEGAKAVNFGTYDPIGNGLVRERKLTQDKSYFLVRAESDPVRVRVEFDPAKVAVNGVVMKQMGWRPWREAFRAALDGTRKDASLVPIEGLLYPDGGGITLNHPSKSAAGAQLDFYLEKLDFDARVLGIEVWNAHFGFGVKDSLAFYCLWDDILRTGRRCFGFFVKDHFLARAGRNVLLVPPSAGLSRETQEHNALKAYRRGAFFGLLGAMATNTNGVPVQPFDFSQFRFARIAVARDAKGEPEAVEVAVTGADKQARPNLQIRFVTESGIARVVNGENHAVFPFPRDAEGTITCRFVRAEAFAYPDALQAGERLAAGRIAAMNVREIARLHDWLDDRRMPVPVVDMIFSQPIRVKVKPGQQKINPMDQSGRR